MTGAIGVRRLAVLALGVLGAMEARDDAAVSYLDNVLAAGGDTAGQQLGECAVPFICVGSFGRDSPTSRLFLSRMVDRAVVNQPRVRASAVSEAGCRRPAAPLPSFQKDGGMRRWRAIRRRARRRCGACWNAYGVRVCIVHAARFTDCHACSCQAVEGGNARAGDGALGCAGGSVDGCRSGPRSDEHVRD
jgi:hypothetical protein